jgi:hypothetical protein
MSNNYCFNNLHLQGIPTPRLHFDLPFEAETHNLDEIFKNSDPTANSSIKTVNVLIAVVSTEIKDV